MNRHHHRPLSHRIIQKAARDSSSHVEAPARGLKARPVVISIAHTTTYSAPPHSDPQLRTRRTLLYSGVWLDATEGLGG